MVCQMKHFLLLILFVLGFVLSFGCKKSDEVEKIIPTNLEVNAVVSSDGSGNVAFTATADNAISYDYEFGNGDIQTVQSGIVTYQYTQVGTLTYSVTVTAKSIDNLTAKETIQVTVTVNEVTPSLYWSDEFNVDGAPDPTKWGYDIGGGGWGNQELEYYTNRTANAVVEKGVLKINAIKESYQGYEYTSARLISKGKFDFKYGKVEVRAKLPAGVGTWPAIWMLGIDISTAGWPYCGEIDIMEHRGSELNKIYGTLHYPGRSGGNADGSTITISNATTEFHIYSIDWTAAYIKIYVDDTLYHTVINSDSIPFNHNFFFIMNIAMGGTFGGTVDPSFTNATMEVDYIRVYK